MTQKLPILIIGAGVSGLSSGILLLKDGYDVTIWARDVPPNTTSNKAAAFWYPYLCNPKGKATVWAGATLRYLKDTVLRDPTSGCIMRTVTEVFDHKVGDPWWAAAVEKWRRPTAEELPGGYVDGYQTNAILMDTSIYVEWLFNQYKSLGGKLVRREVKDIDEALALYDVVVNCTGLGSRELFHDERVFPVRGQVVKVKPNGFERVIADDEGPNNLAVIIPRINDIVLGGTAQPNNWNLDVDPKDTQDILRKARDLSSAFEHVEIVDISVGLRPARDEVRLEREQRGAKSIIHNYGHGGAGFTLSWGCAMDVKDLIIDAVQQTTHE